MNNYKEKLKNKFSTHPLPNYVEEVINRHEKIMETVDEMKDLFEGVMLETNGIKIGHRIRMGDGLYEITLIQKETRNDEPKVNISKVLKTKVSESKENIYSVPLSKMKEGHNFERYNQIVDELFKLKQN